MKEFTFNGQRPDETIEEVIKNHPFVLFWPGIKAVVLLAIPVAVLIFWGASTLFSITTFIGVILAFAIFARAYYIYSASVLLVTVERVIYLNQVGFWQRKIVETNLNKIQDVSSEIKGPIKSALNFGDLIIRTAGATKGDEIVIPNIADPYRIQQEITKRVK